MKKPITIKRILKIIVGIIIFFTLPTALLFGYIYFKYNEPLPISKPNPEADALAKDMLEALNYKAYKNTDYIEFTFANRHHYKWNKLENKCQVYWKRFQVNLDLSNTKKSTVLVGKQTYNGIEKDQYVKKALDYFNNDTFWLVAPYKVFDNGTTRAIAKNDAGEKGLLVSYSSGGSTPGDSYLWHLDENKKPKSFQMWTSILPIQGFPSSWNQWTTTETGAILPTFHDLSFLGLEITGIKAEIDSSKIFYPSKKSIKEFKFKSSVLKLDELNNFKELIKSIDSLRLQNIYPVLTFEYKGKSYKVRNFQSASNVIECYKCKDIIQVYNSDVNQCDKNIISIEDSFKTLEKFYLEKDNKKRILLKVDTDNSIQKTKEILVKLLEIDFKLRKKHNSKHCFEIQFNPY